VVVDARFAARWLIPVARFVLPLAAALALPGLTLAQPYPNRAVKIIVAQGPGTTSDILARMLAPKLSELWDQPVVIDTHAGAAGTIGAAVVARATADGYTLLLASSSNLSLAAVQVKDLPYDPVSDFAPIGRIASIPWALAVNAKLPAKTIPELVAFARAHPGRLTGGSTGVGSMAAFGLEMLTTTAGIEILNVPYRTAGASILGVVAGEVDMIFTDLELVAPQAKAGTLRLLAAAGKKRLPSVPNLPTMAEQGISGFALEPWYGVAAPAGTPADVLAKLTRGLRDVLRMPEMRQRILDLGYVPIEDTPAEFAAVIRSDIEKFSAAGKRSRGDTTR
jgi:tripartite-type tricarboxylate transporter receptor subunit TctC